MWIEDRNDVPRRPSDKSFYHSLEFKVGQAKFELAVVKGIISSGYIFLSAKTIYESDLIRKSFPQTNNWQIGQVFRKLFSRNLVKVRSEVGRLKYEILDKNKLKEYEKDLENEVPYKETLHRTLSLSNLMKEFMHS